MVDYRFAAMPTNREWLEHTERAAWDTVQSLRRQIEEERVRLGRHTPVRESWHKIIELLDVAKAEHGITAEHYASVVEQLTAELRRAKEERERLAEQLETERKASRIAEQRVEVITLEPDDRPRRGSRVRWFAEKIAALRRERAALLRTRTRPTFERLLGALEAKVDELGGATPSDMLRIAVDIGALALRLAEHAEQRRGRRSSLDEEEE